MHAVHPSCDSPNTSRRFALGATSNACLVGENTKCSVAALQGWEGLRSCMTTSTPALPSLSTNPFLVPMTTRARTYVLSFSPPKMTPTLFASSFSTKACVQFQKGITRTYALTAMEQPNNRQRQGRGKPGHDDDVDDDAATTVQVFDISSGTTKKKTEDTAVAVAVAAAVAAAACATATSADAIAAAAGVAIANKPANTCLLYTSPSPRD